MLFLCSCATPWPSLPPVTYNGGVTSGITAQPISGALVTAYRPGMRGIILFKVGDESIGVTRTDQSGRFTLTTSTGWASKLIAVSPDERQSGIQSVSRKDEDIDIVVSPEFRRITYRAIDPLSPETESTALAIKEIMKEIVRTGGHLDSLSGYLRNGVITQEQFALFTRNPHLYFGDDPEATYQWGERVFLIPDGNSKILLVDVNQRK